MIKSWSETFEQEYDDFINLFFPSNSFKTLTFLYNEGFSKIQKLNLSKKMNKFFLLDDCKISLKP